MDKNYIGTRGVTAIDAGTATPTAVATASPLTGERIFITDIACSTASPYAKVRVLDGATTIWEIEVPYTSTATPYALTVSFQTPLVGTVNTKVHLQVDGVNTAPAAYACLIGFRSKN